MASISLTLQQPRRLFPFSFFIVLLLILAAVVVVVQSHAVQRHGEEAEAIRKCLDNNGPFQIWRAFDGETFYRLCQLDDERWGLQAIVKEGKTWVEKTAFVRGDGSWKALMNYLQRFATRYTGSLS
jgi:hypothetical protein